MYETSLTRRCTLSKGTRPFVGSLLAAECAYTCRDQGKWDTEVSIASCADLYSKRPDPEAQPAGLLGRGENKPMRSNSIIVSWIRNF